MRFFEKFVKPYKNLGEEQRLYALFIMNYEVCFFILPLISAAKIRFLLFSPAYAPSQNTCLSCIFLVKSLKINFG